MFDKTQKYRYFIYCRRSKGRQEEQSPSIKAQYNELIGLAKKENLEIIDVFKETQSAFELGRPKFEEMVERIKNGEANGILTWEISRLSRNSQDTSAMQILVDSKKLTSIRTPAKEYIDKDGEDLLLSFELVLSRQYSKEVAKRTRRGLRHKLEKEHEWPGWAPLGYLNIRKENQIISGRLTPYKRQLQKLLEKKWKKQNCSPKAIEVNPLKGSLVKRVFEDFASGNYSLSVMLDRMEKMGLRGKSGKMISKSCLVSLLQNPFYYGYMRLKGNLYEGTHEPLITKSLFDKVQNVLSEKNKPIKKRWQFDFTGLIKCGHCGCSITAEKKKGKYIYYRCTKMRNRRMSMLCPQPTLKEEDLRVQLEKEVKKITINDMIKELLAEAIKQAHDKEKEAHQKGIKGWLNIYNGAERKLNKLFELFYSDSITQGEFVVKKEELMEEKQRAKERLDAHGKAQKAWFNYAEELIITTNHAYKIFEEGTPKEIKMLLKAIGKNYILKDGILTLQLKEPFNYIAQLNKSKSSNKNDWLRRQDSNYS